MKFVELVEVVIAVIALLSLENALARDNICDPNSECTHIGRCLAYKKIPNPNNVGIVCGPGISLFRLVCCPFVLKSSSQNASVPPDLCKDAKIDTVTLTQSGSTYFFKGDFYWKVLDNEIADGYPRKIVDDWDGLESNLDAAFTLPNGTTYFFKGSHYWVFSNQKMYKGYPKPLNNGFPGIPSMLDTAFVWSKNSKIYFFKGNEYWRYDTDEYPQVSNEFPRQISSWWHLPDNIDAAFQWQNNWTYFFKGDQYYLYDDEKEQVQTAFDPQYPRPTANWWFGCK